MKILSSVVTVFPASGNSLQHSKVYSFHTLQADRLMLSNPSGSLYFAASGCEEPEITDRQYEFMRTIHQNELVVHGLDPMGIEKLPDAELAESSIMALNKALKMIEDLEEDGTLPEGARDFFLARQLEEARQAGEYEG